MEYICTWAYPPFDAFDAVVICRGFNVYHFCALAQGGERKWERKLYTSRAKQAFLYLVLATVWKIQLCSWQSGMCFLSAISKKGKINMGIFCSENNYSVKSHKFLLFLLMKPQTH